MVVIDGYFYSVRVITHVHLSQVYFGGVYVEAQYLNKFVSYVIFFMLCYDLVLVYDIGLLLSSKGNPYHQDEVKNYDEAIKLVLVRQHLEEKLKSTCGP